MAIAYFHFRAELNHFLPRHHKQVRISHVFEEKAFIKQYAWVKENCRLG
ncbi:ubiquitin family protein [Nostoc commune]|nr:hypothetical protein [Nostoc commune]